MGTINEVLAVVNTEIISHLWLQLTKIIFVNSFFFSCSAKFLFKPQDNQFPDDLLCEIFSHLPVETLNKLRLLLYQNRLRLVNKSLHRLISQPQFIRTQAQRSTQNVMGLFHVTRHESSVATYVSLDGHKEGEYPEVSLSPKGGQICSVFDSYGGLLLCGLGGRPQELYLYNPANNMEQRIDNFRWSNYDGRFGLVVNLTEASNNVVLQYKVVYVYQLFRVFSVVYGFVIYSSDTGSWRISRRTKYCVPSQFITTFGAVYAYGYLHWLRENGDIIAFDVEDDYVRVVRLPVPMSLIGAYTNVLLTTAESSMIFLRVLGREIELWRLEDYEKEVWKKEWSVVCENVDACAKVIPIFYNANANLVVLMVYSIDLVYRLFTYNIENKNWKQIGRLESWMNACRGFFPYISNLLGQGIFRRGGSMKSLKF
ncbi:hypothetical protein AAC387_Pa04g2097 [Persea americana]